MEGKVKVVVLGSESSHVEAYSEEVSKGGQDLVAGIWSRDSAEAHRKAIALGIPRVYESIEDASAAADFMMLLERYGETHKETALRALRPNSILYVDKPFTNSYEEAADILKKAAHLGACVTSFSPYRFSREVDEARSWIQGVGRVESVQIRGPVDTKYIQTDSAKKTHFYGIHTVDILLALTGPGYVDVQAQLKSQSIVVELATHRLPCARLDLFRGGEEEYIVEIRATDGQALKFSIDPGGDFYRRSWAWMKNKMAIRDISLANTTEALEAIAILDAIDASVELGRAVRLDEIRGRKNNEL